MILHLGHEETFGIIGTTYTPTYICSKFKCISKFVCVCVFPSGTVVVVMVMVLHWCSVSWQCTGPLGAIVGKVRPVSRKRKSFHKCQQWQRHRLHAVAPIAKHYKRQWQPTPTTAMAIIFMFIMMLLLLLLAPRSCLYACYDYKNAIAVNIPTTL